MNQQYFEDHMCINNYGLLFVIVCEKNLKVYLKHSKFWKLKCCENIKEILQVVFDVSFSIKNAFHHFWRRAKFLKAVYIVCKTHHS